MRSHLTMNLFPALILEEKGGKQEPRAAIQSWRCSVLPFGGWIPVGFTHPAAGILTSHWFQERLTAPSRGANYSQQVVIASTMTLGSGLSQRRLSRFLCAPLTRQPWTRSHHTQGTLPVSRGLKWEDGDSALLINLWFLELFVRWICQTNSPWLENKTKRRGRAEVPDVAWVWKEGPPQGVSWGLLEETLPRAVRPDRQSTGGPSGYLLHTLPCLSSTRSILVHGGVKCIWRIGELTLVFKVAYSVIRFSHPLCQQLVLEWTCDPIWLQDVFAGGCGFTRHEQVSHPLTPWGISWCCGWTDGRGEAESRMALLNCWTRPEVGPALGHPPMRLNKCHCFSNHF